jgi:hypothetical protein
MDVRLAITRVSGVVGHREVARRDAILGRVRQGSSTAFAAWLGGVAVFQTALALGAPWGAAAWGGAHRGVLPRGLRAASAVGAIGWVAASAVVAGVLGGDTARRRALVATTAFAGVSVLLNAASRSRVERVVWVPMTVTGTALGVRAVRRGPRS